MAFAELIDRGGGIGSSRVLGIFIRVDKYWPSSVSKRLPFRCLPLEVEWLLDGWWLLWQATASQWSHLFSDAHISSQEGP